MPNPINPQDWDRYAYVKNNPINYNDPSGNKACDGKDSNSGGCSQITSKDLSDLMKWKFGWTTRGKFRKIELETILDAGDMIAKSITSLTGKWGQGWVRSNLGNAIFNQSGVTSAVAKTLGASAFVFPYHDVNLNKGDYDSSTVVHELGHVLDNNNKKGILPATINGGGPADTMVLAVGGSPSACQPRLQCWSAPNAPQGHQWYIDNVAGDSPWPEKWYGNNGVSDDFAEVFRWTITDQRQVPSGRLQWMQDYLSSLP